MTNIGNYDNRRVYELTREEFIPKDDSFIYVNYKGEMYFGGVKIGRLNRDNYRVLEYDMEIYRAHRRAEETRAKQQKKEESRAVPVCVAESTVIGTNGELNNTDEFFARLAKDIDDMLAGVKNFEGDFAIGSE